MATDTETKHIKFDDEDAAVSTVETTSAVASKVKSNKDKYLSSDDSDSDDDAPEEENVQDDKDRITKEQQLQRQKQQELNKLEKDKRRERNKILVDQRKIAEEKQIEEELEEDNNMELTELPMELLQEVDQVEIPKVLPKRINFNEMDTQDLDIELKNEFKQRKKKTLKQLRSLQQNKGPVTVRVVSSVDKRKPPKKEVQVMATRDRWLKRKALKKK